MNKMKISYLVVGSLVLMASMCGPGDSAPADKSTLKIALADSLSVEYDDEARRLPENIRKLCALLISDTRDCKHTHILDPTLFRLDLNKELSLKTVIEKGGAKNVNNPKVIDKLIKKNFDELIIPIEFTKQKASNLHGYVLISDFITGKASKDSILVFAENGSLDTYVLNNRTYKVFTSIDDVRNRMSSILCQNQKANFILLINPPEADKKQKETSKIDVATPITPTASVVPKKPPVFNKQVVNHPHVGKSNTNHGDLTMVKGSEGCDLCTRYYSATDNLGQTRQVTERNSTFCCPCGKTIQMKGRTYRMDCDGAGSNRLELID